MSTITKEQLQQIEAAAKEVLWPVVWSEKKARKLLNEKITPEVVLELARIALASLEAQAVAWLWSHRKHPSEVTLIRPEDDERADGAHWSGWSCQALYAAQPASAAMKDHQIRELVNDLRDIAVEYHGTQQLRERIARTIRAAMLQGVESDFREIVNSSTKHFRENAETSTKCWCRTCRPVTISDMRFVVCPDCGNKRCPHANDHRHECTGSNEPGQEGSAYPAAPKQEAK